ncbi:hypothetical protein I5L01_16005, partial [Erythrobacter sp. YJ-T3-07]|uniref:hypothetical protein n=1 Tax=Erythrobacter sp. YJ-T3-07 TaxID=2793063 RepID=UPI0018D37131
NTEEPSETNTEEPSEANREEPSEAKTESSSTNRYKTEDELGGDDAFPYGNPKDMNNELLQDYIDTIIEQAIPDLDDGDEVNRKDLQF